MLSKKNIKNSVEYLKIYLITMVLTFLISFTFTYLVYGQTVNVFYIGLSYQVPLLAFFLFYLFRSKISMLIFFAFSSLFVVDRIYATLNNDYIFKMGLAPGFSNEWKKVGNFPISSYIDMINKPETIKMIFICILLIVIYIGLAFYVKKMIKSKQEVIEEIKNKNIITLILFTSVFSYYIYGYEVLGYAMKGANPIFKGINISFNEIKDKLIPFERAKPFDIEYNKEVFKNIIVITDESIQYNFVKNNSVIKSMEEKGILLNIAPVITEANCSFTSNRGLLQGGIRNEKMNPAILFDYIRPETNFYENIPLVSDSYNFQNNQKTNFIFKSSLKHEIKERDIKVLEETKEAIDKNEVSKNIFYIEKIGCHFPYRVVVDETKENTKEYKEFVEDKFKNNFFQTEERKTQYLTYEKVLKTTVDDYFSYIEKTFLSDPKYKDTLIVYVGDHGQNLNKPDMMTHCDYNNKYSYIIPSYIMSANKDKISALKDEYNKYYKSGKLNHKNDLTGFILEMMGYKKESINKFYSSILDNRKEENRKVFINNDYIDLNNLDFSEELNLRYF